MTELVISLIAGSAGLYTLAALFIRTGGRVRSGRIERPADLDRMDRLVFWVDDKVGGESARDILWPGGAK